MKKLLASNGFLLLLSIVLGFAASEYVLAPAILLFTGQPGRSLTLLGVAAMPNAQLDDTKINSQGFTGDVLETAKPAGTKRILTLGGSAIFNRRMTERLGASLKAATRVPLEIEGGALRTHTSRDSLIKYQKYFSAYNFDYILIYEGINDLWMNHVHPSDFSDDYSQGGPWRKRNVVLDHSLIARYIYNTFLWKKPDCFSKMDWPVGSPCHNKAHYRATITLEKNLRKLVRLVREDGAVPILMTVAYNIPPNYTMDAFRQGTLGYNNPTNYDKMLVEKWGEVGYVAEGMRRNNEAIRQISSEEGVLLIDQETMLSRDISNFGDVVHFSEEGTDRFVKIITEFFLQHQLLPPSRSMVPGSKCIGGMPAGSHEVRAISSAISWSIGEGSSHKVIS